MSALFNYLTVHYLDDNGKVAQSFITTQDQDPGREADALLLIAALQACSDAKIVAVQMNTTTLLEGSFGTGPYKTVWDRGVLLGKFVGSTTGYRSTIVAPKAEIFLPGNRVIDLTNPLITTLQTEVEAIQGNEDTTPCGPFNYGRRQTAAGS